MLPLGIVLTSQMRAVLSSDAVTTRLPSGLKAAESTHVVMAFEGRDFAPGLGVPEARGVVIGGGDDALAVRAEGGRHNRSVMAFEGRDFAPGLGVPEARGRCQRRR